MTHDEETDAIAWKAVNALIRDAKAEFKGEQGEAFAWAIYNAVRRTDLSQLENLRDLLRKRGIEITPTDKAGSSWVN